MSRCAEGIALEELKSQEVSVSPASTFLLASGKETMIAGGVQRSLTTATGHGLADEASSFFAALNPTDQTAVLVGALPFKHDNPAYLFQPRELIRFSGDGDLVRALREATGGSAERVPDSWQVSADPSRDEYAGNVARALVMLEQDSHSLEKVVLARSLLLQARSDIDPRAIFTRLCVDPSVNSFYVPLSRTQARVLVGATPELLLEKSGARVYSRPLAGSARRSKDAVQDVETAQLLLRSEKDLREHAAVRESVLDGLVPFCRNLKASDRPYLVSTASMWHLATEIEGELQNDQTTSLELALALHPTAAVCGAPQGLAADVIKRLEPFDRGFFTGAVGWCDSRGDGRWYVAIRCAEISGNTARLYAGAGVVAGSDPEREAAETSGKFRALLDALGVADDGF